MKILRSNCQRQSGFTFIELLLTVAMIAAMTGAVAPIYYAFYTRNDLHIAAETVAQTLRRAQSLAQAVAADGEWGLYIQPGAITVFQGGSFAARNAQYDETYDVAKHIIPSGSSEIIFNRVSGKPVLIGSVILTSAANETKTITVNGRGTIVY